MSAPQAHSAGSGIDDELDVTAHVPLLEAALAEDHARDDVTARAVVPEDRVVEADVVAKADGVLAGLPLALPTFRLLDPDAEVTLHQADGETVGPRSRVLTVRGRARAILSAERTVLNLLCRLSGIASLTSAFVEGVMGTGARILDTRKTLPGWRSLEKYAVRCGGGENHRMDLADAAMVKENHLYAAFGHTGPDAIREATTRCRGAVGREKTLYVEVENLEELAAAADAGADVLMCDGFDLGTLRRAVQIVRARPAPRPEIEITGGVTLANVAAFAAAGANRISIGAITQAAPALDLHLRVRGDGS